MTVFRAIWPITDETVPYDELIVAARAEVPTLVNRAHARLAGPIRFHLARSVDVPGSGRVTPSVLVAEAPAESAVARDYWRAG